MTQSLKVVLVFATLGPSALLAGGLAYVSNPVTSQLSVIDSATNAVVGVIPVPGTPTTIAITRGGSRAYVSLPTYAGQPALAVVDLSNRSVVDTIPLPFNPGPIALSPEGTHAWILPDDGSNTAVSVDLLSKAVAKAVSVGVFPLAIAVAPDGRHVYTANQTSGTVSVIDASLNSVIATIPVGIYPDGVAVSPLGTEVWVVNAGPLNASTISVIGTFTNTVIDTIPVPNGPTGLAFNALGTRVYVAHGGSNAPGISVLDTATRSFIVSVPTGSFTFSVAISEDGTRVFGDNELSDNVSVLDTATNTIIANVPLGSYSFIVATPPNSGAPVADASATPAQVISANNANATVTLDGSRSFDPNGSPLTYNWFVKGSPVGTGVTVAVVLGMGPNTVRLDVSNGAATASTTISVTVFGTPVADASATPAQVISPNNANATLTLNGSRSSDPNGYPLTYNWFVNGYPVGTGVTVAVVLGMGPNTVRLDVSNGAATASTTISVTVFGTPVADASATPAQVISPNNTNATVTLNGSRSSDPNGFPLTYNWFVNGNPAGTGITRIAILGIGTNAVRLDVGDGVATASTTITVTVITAAQAVNSLAGQVNGANIPVGVQSTLLGDLNAAAASFNRGNFSTGSNQLRQFISDVTAQSGKKLDGATANALVVVAQAIIGAVSGG